MNIAIPFFSSRPFPYTSTPPFVLCYAEPCAQRRTGSRVAPSRGLGGAAGPRAPGGTRGAAEPRGPGAPGPLAGPRGFHTQWRSVSCETALVCLCTCARAWQHGTSHRITTMWYGTLPWSPGALALCVALGGLPPPAPPSVRACARNIAIRSRLSCLLWVRGP